MQVEAVPILHVLGPADSSRSEGPPYWYVYYPASLEQCEVAVSSHNELINLHGQM